MTQTLLMALELWLWRPRQSGGPGALTAPGAPTDPDVRDYRIRLFKQVVRGGRGMAGSGSA